ncbi:MAG: hypothetical protein O8C66_08930 [Candidatus Methanoperedens sp.]|nr:hypothetical protein [Candidatus Methanoperedens sp.]MCZ7370620.1 hypothetical protein [Candidatus Methanoperedens sp.]
MAEILKLKRIVDTEYSDITIDSNIYHDKLRVFLKDGSIADIWFSTKIPGRFSYHWERRQINGKMYRPLTHAGKEFLPTPNISIMVHKTMQKRAE